MERLIDDSPEYLTLAEYHPQGCLMTFLQHNIVTWMEMCLLLHSATAGLAFLHQMDNEGIIKIDLINVFVILYSTQV